MPIRWGGRVGLSVGVWLVGALPPSEAAGRALSPASAATDGQPAAPAPAEPVSPEPTEPPAAGEPTEPPAAGEPTEPPAAGEPTEAPAAGEPPEPPAAGGPTEPTDPTEPTEPTDPTEPTEAVEPADPEEPAAPEEPVAVGVQGVEDVGAVEPTEEIERPRRKRPMHRLIYSNLTAARVNPLGLVNEFTAGWRYQLVKKNSVLFRESFVAAQLHTYLTPAYGRIGPKIDIQPLALLNLSATYDYTGYFGSFGLFQSFDSPTAEWSDSELNRRDDLGDPTLDNYRTTGHFVTLSALLQAKVGRIAVRDNLKFYWADYDLRAGDTVSYDQTLDITIPNRGWAMTNDLDLLYLFDFGLTLGARYTVTEAFYQPRHFQAAEPVSRPNGPTHRVGPAMLYTFFDRPDKRFNKPTLIVLTQWWAAHRFRTGQDVSPAVPYLVIGFRFEGDLLPDPASWHAKTEPKFKRRRKAKAAP